MNSNTGHLPAIGQIFHTCRLYRQVDIFKLSDDESEERIINLQQWKDLLVHNIHLPSRLIANC